MAAALDVSPIPVTHVFKEKKKSFNIWMKFELKGDRLTKCNWFIFDKCWFDHRYKLKIMHFGILQSRNIIRNDNGVNVMVSNSGCVLSAFQDG